MAPLLVGAGAVGRGEAVGRERMTVQTLDFALERVGLEVDPVTGGRRDPLPGFLGLAPDVALLADPARYLRVRRNLVGPVGHPPDQLERLRPQLEGMAGVARKGIVLALERSYWQVRSGIGPRDDPAAGHEDVAALA